MAPWSRTPPTPLLLMSGLWTVLYWWVFCYLRTPCSWWDGCDMLAAGVGHMGRVRRGQTYWYHVLTDKTVDVVLFFVVVFIFFLWCLRSLVVLLNCFWRCLVLRDRTLVRLVSLIDIVEPCWCAMLVMKVLNLLVSNYALCFVLHVHVLLFYSCWWSMRAVTVGYWTECCCCSGFTAVLLLLCLFLFQAKGDHKKKSPGWFLNWAALIVWILNVYSDDWIWFEVRRIINRNGSNGVTCVDPPPSSGVSGVGSGGGWDNIVI